MLITLHVTNACAACPYVGKAHGFEYAQSQPGCPEKLACVGPLAAAVSPTALLLALEPYTVNVSAARAARAGMAVCPQGKTLSTVAEPSSPAAQPCLAPPADAADVQQAADRESSPTCGDARAACQSMNLWEYLVWLREHDLQLTIDEIKTLALQLVSALHSLHTDANVRCWPDGLVHDVFRLWLTVLLNALVP